MKLRHLILILALLVVSLTAFLLPHSIPAAAQGQPDCGIVDSIDYPIDSVTPDFDDFGMYRAGFGGQHSGVDMAFGRYGEPVHAAARGRVTFSDPEGWDTEKGVVVIEHHFPDGSVVFTLYGHMEEANGYTFPRVGDCVEKGQIVGGVGSPKNSAVHLHYEIRKMRASTGGPGYATGDPLDSGWLHPIEFTEQWHLRFNPAFRGIVTSTKPPTAPPVRDADGGAVFPSATEIEARSGQNLALWKLSVQDLTGIVRLPDSRILGRTAQNGVLIVDNGRFAATWQPDRPLKSPPMMLGNVVAFLSDDNRVVAYDAAGVLQWQTDPLGTIVVNYEQSGDLLAVSAEQENTYRLFVLNAEGKVAYEGTAPSPIVAVTVPVGGFLVMVSSQVSYLGPDLNLYTLIDAGIALGRSSRAVVDNSGAITLYPGQGAYIYNYALNSGLRWKARLPVLPTQPPLLAVGAGCLVYALTPDGSLLAYASQTGELRGQTALYAGGIHGQPASRFLQVLPNEQVVFSAGYLSVATIDGLTLANLDKCQQ